MNPPHLPHHWLSVYVSCLAHFGIYWHLKIVVTVIYNLANLLRVKIIFSWGSGKKKTQIYVCGRWGKHWSTLSIIYRGPSATSKHASIAFKDFTRKDLFKFKTNHQSLRKSTEYISITSMATVENCTDQNVNQWLWRTKKAFITICRYWHRFPFSFVWPDQNYSSVWLCCLAQTGNLSLFFLSLTSSL